MTKYYTVCKSKIEWLPPYALFGPVSLKITTVVYLFDNLIRMGIRMKPLDHDTSTKDAEMDSHK